MKTLYDLIADKIEADPVLLAIPLDNIPRWLANGYTAPHRLEQWRAIILRAQQSPDGMRELLALLRDRGETAERLKEFSPFAGVLTAKERRQATTTCAYHF